MPGKKIEETIRRNVIREFNDGISKAAISKKYGISRSSVRRIIDGEMDTNSDKIMTERQRKIESLEKRVMALENKILARVNRRW